MTEAAAAETPKSVVAELMSALSLTQIVFVDDLFAKTISLPDVQAAQLSLAPVKVQEALGVPDLNFPDDRDIRRQMFEDHWNRLQSAVQQDVGRRLLVLAGESPSVAPADAEAAGILGEILAPDRLVTLSLQEWNAQRSAILERAKAGRSLLLFDQDLRDDSGSATGGMMIIADIVSATDADSVMCGLLTHTAQIVNEYDRWKTLAQEHGVDRDRFVVIAKENLKSDPLQFARMLKLVALSPDCRRMKALVHNILVDSAAHAAKELETVDVFEFEHAVLRVAHEEGIWEPEMLLRLFSIFQRTELRRRTYSDTVLGTLTQRLRSISHIPTESSSSPRISTWKLQQRDMYEPGDHINVLHLPVEIGDVFAKAGTQSTKHFILLGQACDLMVRADGERRPKLTQALLGEVHVVRDPTRYDEMLPYFGEDPGNKHYVRFKRIHSVPIVVLDLCVFNADGVSRLPEECPQQVHPAWQARHAVLKGWLRSELAEYDEFGKGKAADKVLASLRLALLENFPPVVGRNGLFKAKIDSVDSQRILTFNCARVKRLHRPRAAALALYYASCFSRPAFDRDLGDVDDDVVDRQSLSEN